MVQLASKPSSLWHLYLNHNTAGSSSLVGGRYSDERLALEGYFDTVPVSLDRSPNWTVRAASLHSKCFFLVNGLYANSLGLHEGAFGIHHSLVLLREERMLYCCRRSQTFVGNENMKLLSAAGAILIALPIMSLLLLKNFVSGLTSGWR